METFNEDDIQYQQAKRQVERLRGFYSHLFIYVLVNMIIVWYNFTALKPGESYFQFKNFLTATFWGIGLLIHGVIIFISRTGFIKKWEEAKIRELIDKEKN
ncbi:2TM domain-containing protein [Chryseobacterium pennipullorum]|uniref:Histidine kinase n=1 Tax=Chryseobacterium pennipullorum TaxID=2258963 RepID=A0A3D9ALR1_9FLAO|nr:2TM domain-containing protein [Chryseobacterium pennipullorum]REC42221.1 histidine kinase [Chryseobacterium pennipullorum]